MRSDHRQTTRTPFFRLRRLAAGVLLSVVVAAVVLSAAFLVLEAGHDCDGHDCPVCEFLAVSASNLELLGSGFAPAPFVTAGAAPVCAALPHFAVRLAVRSSPVALKVRLNL